jgi:hypothetical protein
MTTAPCPALKSPPRAPDPARLAGLAGTPAASSAPKVAARQGVRTAVGSEPHQTAERRVIAWLHVVCPSGWDAPVRATSHCSCGRHVTAATRRDVMALVEAHREHIEHCPLHTAPERRQTA